MGRKYKRDKRGRFAGGAGGSHSGSQRFVGGGGKRTNSPRVRKNLSPRTKKVIKYAAIIGATAAAVELSGAGKGFRTGFKASMATAKHNREFLKAAGIRPTAFRGQDRLNFAPKVKKRAGWNT
jgi:hypothetical protein